MYIKKVFVFIKNVDHVVLIFDTNVIIKSIICCCADGIAEIQTFKIYITIYLFLYLTKYYEWQIWHGQQATMQSWNS